MTDDDDFNDDLDAYLTENPGLRQAVNTAVDLSKNQSHKPTSDTNDNSASITNTSNTNTPLAATNHNSTAKRVATTIIQPQRSISSNRPHSRASTISSRPNSKQQRDLFGNIISSSQTSDEISSSQLDLPIQQEVPTHHMIDFEAIKTYIYPINYEIRDYQFNIIEKCFYNNILVALPTGLGKTFIAATIILNYFRWFPELKIIFMAPTKPLVAQQIKACFNIIGMKDKFAILLDKLKRNRQDIWEQFNIFFTTPQVVENDLCAGIIDPKSISLLIIDEAHKAKGNYAYNNVVKFINRFSQSYRILALTATPSATVEGIKEIIENLGINKIEIRTEKSIDIIKYFKTKSIDKLDIDVEKNFLILTCLTHLKQAVVPFIRLANENHLITVSDPDSLNSFKLLEVSKRNLARNDKPESVKWLNHFLIKLLMFIANGFKKLKIYGYRNFKKFFLDNYVKGKLSKNKLMTEFFGNESILELLSFLNNNDPKSSSTPNDNISHPKIEALIEYTNDFYLSRPNFNDSKIIIFTEYRDSALEIVNNIEQLHNRQLNPHIFIGQAPESGNDGLSLDSKDKGKNNPTRTSSEDAKLKGMNQKVQKQLIKDFKEGKFNILVATSIGEEGLDIGEVDLIICYDSTSSPIKNIQRLGRTGRKREGQILMLFSSNEREKFEKAMDNYEWIQRYIIKHEKELTKASAPKRILPKKYKPILVKKFIDINEITVDDNDEIIKIAMNYMKSNEKNWGKPASGKSKDKGQGKADKRKKSTPITKKFFMPDNVETGFKNVSELLNPKSNKENINDNNNNNRSPSALQELELIDTSSINLSKRSEKYQNSFNSEIKAESRDIDKHAPQYKVQTPKNKSLGPKRRKLKGADNQNQDEPDRLKSPADDDVIFVDHIESNSKDWDDEFDDDLDDKLKALDKAESDVKPEPNEFDNELHSQLDILASSTQFSSGNNPPSNPQNERDMKADYSKTIAAENHRVSYELVDDTIAPNTFNETDGFLSSQEKLDLFTNYYNPIAEPKSYVTMVNPSSTSSLISTKSIRFAKFMQFTTDLGDKQAMELIKSYQHHNDCNLESVSVESCIKYLNNH